MSFCGKVGSVFTGGGRVMTGDFSVLVEGSPIAHVNSSVSPYQKKGFSKMVTGPFSVFVNGKPVCRSNSVNTFGDKLVSGLVFSVRVGG